MTKAKRSRRAVIARMKSMPIDDKVFGSEVVRQDGLLHHSAYRLRVKMAAGNAMSWGQFSLTTTTSSQEAFHLLSEGNYQLVQQ